MRNDRAGSLLAIAAGTLLIFFLVWAAMHDIAHANELNYSLEYVVLLFCPFAFGALYAMGLRVLRHGARVTWLTGTALLLALYNLGAASALLRPKYPLDPILGTAFLIAGVPLLALTGYHLLRGEPRQ